MKEEKRILLNTVGILTEGMIISTKRKVNTNLAKIRLLAEESYISENQIDQEMRSKVPLGKECTRCPMKKENYCSFLQLRIVRDAKACYYNL